MQLLRLLAPEVRHQEARQIPVGRQELMAQPSRLSEAPVVTHRTAVLVERVVLAQELAGQCPAAAAAGPDRLGHRRMARPDGLFSRTHEEIEMAELIAYVFVAAFFFFLGWKVGNKKDFPFGGGGRNDDARTDLK